MSEARKAGTLYLVPNLLDDLSTPELVLPALVMDRVRLLRRFVVEGEKSAWRFLSRVLDREALAGVSMERLDEHTEAKDVPLLLSPLLKGEDVGLLSEAGIPCVADPGAALVALAHDAGIRVQSLVGPSSILLGLSASGLDGQRFSFLGYLPQDPLARREALAAIDRGVRQDGATRIFIETPYRNARLLAECIGTLSADTRLCVAASLTGKDERVRSADIASWRATAWELGKEPAVFLIGRAGLSGAPDKGPPCLDRGTRMGHSGNVCRSRKR